MPDSRLAMQANVFASKRVARADESLSFATASINPQLIVTGNTISAFVAQSFAWVIKLGVAFICPHRRYYLARRSIAIFLI
jgi:hypothetical protein